MEVTITDALRALGLEQEQVLSWSEKPDRFVIVTKPAGKKYTIMKVSIKPETTTANITEVTPAEPKPVTEVEPETEPKPVINIQTPKTPPAELKSVTKKAVEAGIEKATKVIPITKKKTAKKVTKKVTKKKK